MFQRSTGFSWNVFTCGTQGGHTCDGKMASGDVLDLLEDCAQRIQANTAQPENFLRQVFLNIYYLLRKKNQVLSLRIRRHCGES